jgi:hypothetical protein
MDPDLDGGNTPMSDNYSLHSKTQRMRTCKSIGIFSVATFVVFIVGFGGFAGYREFRRLPSYAQVESGSFQYA